MYLYYYNNNLDSHGNHEVHTSSCPYGPNLSNRVTIGYKSDCHDAIRSAKIMTGKSNFDGC